jgi:creatinine amidohydrolase
MDLALLDLPHRDAADRVRRAPVVWVPVNPVEYHGPHLPLHTDALLTRAWVGELHRALFGDGEPVCTADLEVGVEPTPGPGTRAVSYGEVRRSLIRTCRSLVDLGATAIVPITFHGAPLHNLALASAVRWCRARGVRAAAPFQEVVRRLGSDDPVFREVVAQIVPERRAEVAASLPHDFHAGLLETSLLLRWGPEHVSPVHRELPPCPIPAPWGPLAAAARLTGAPELTVAAYGAGWMRLRPFPGYTGHPALATAEIGALFARAVVDGVVPALRAALDGAEPAAPPFRWVGPLSLWGLVRP